MTGSGGTTGSAGESAVLVLVEEAEPAVGDLRARLDPTAALGVGAHVTVLYPFVAPGEITAATVARLGDALAGATPFRCRFAEVGWFGDDYVWLAPDPRTPFDDLTARVARAFPEHPPYGGEHEPRPHLTLGYRRHASVAALREAADQVGPRLPVHATVRRVHLLAGTRSGSEPWHLVAAVPLGGEA